MTFEEYRKHDAVALAELVKKKEVTSAELLEIAIKRTEEVNPKINAVVTPCYDLAKEQLKNTNGNTVFGGIPYLMKDLGPELKGVRHTMGTRFMQDYIAKEDSVVTQRVKKSGLIIFGKTNTPEFGLTPYTESELLKPARNPWNTDHTTGGSSGGSGAAVAAGIVPIASANDGGGSIRIPASCNGLFGMKPSRGRVTLGFQNGELWGGAVCEGAVSRSVRDSALYLDMIQGSAPGEPYSIQQPEKPYFEEIKSEPGKLKIAFSLEHPMGRRQDEENIAAINNTVKLLQELGHEVNEIPLPYKKELLTEILYTMVLGETSATIDYLGEVNNKKPRVKDFEPNTWLLYKLGKLFSARDYALAKLKWNETTRKMGILGEKYDALLTPTLGMKPFKIGSLQNNKIEDGALRTLNALGLTSLIKGTGIIEKTATKIFSWIPYAPLANITGQPSMTVPLHWSKENLPVGVMFTGRLNDEATLFRLAAQLEKAQPWFDKVPTI